MVNILASSRNLAQLMLFKTKKVTKNHKKKIIFALALVVIAYGAKKLTIGHFIRFIQAYTKIMELITAPQTSKLRSAAEYSHQQYSASKAIYECLKVSQFQGKIQGKQNCFEQLKYEHLTGTVMTLVLYNASNFYFLIQNKYSQDFLELNASTQFQHAMYEIRKKFTQQIPHSFAKIKEILYQDISRIELKQVCSIQDISQTFQNLVEKLLKDKFDLTKQPIDTSIKQASKQAKNRFLSPYEYVVQQKPKLSQALSKLFKTIGSIISYGDWFPPAKIYITNERLSLVNYAYIEPLKQGISSFGVKIKQRQGWPSQESRDLFKLVMQELELGLLSLNYSVMLKNYANYNLKILRNRIKKFMAINKKTEIPFVVLLHALHKILNEEFFKQNQQQIRDIYHNTEMKKSIELVTSCEEQEHQQKLNVIIFEQKQAISEQQQILEQIYLKHSFQHLQKQFELKIFNQRSGFVLSPKRDSDHQAEEMKKLLKLIGTREFENRQI